MYVYNFMKANGGKCQFTTSRPLDAYHFFSFILNKEFSYKHEIDKQLLYIQFMIHLYLYWHLLLDLGCCAWGRVASSINWLNVTYDRRTSARLKISNRIHRLEILFHFMQWSVHSSFSALESDFQWWYLLLN